MCCARSCYSLDLMLGGVRRPVQTSKERPEVRRPRLTRVPQAVANRKDDGHGRLKKEAKMKWTIKPSKHVIEQASESVFHCCSSQAIGKTPMPVPLLCG